MLNFRNRIALQVLFLLNTQAIFSTSGQPGSSSDLAPVQGVTSTRIEAPGSLDLLFQREIYKRLLDMTPQEIEHSPTWCCAGNAIKTAYLVLATGKLVFAPRVQ